MSSAPRRSAPKVTAISGSVVDDGHEDACRRSCATGPTAVRQLVGHLAAASCRRPARRAADTPKRHQARRSTSRGGSGRPRPGRVAGRLGGHRRAHRAVVRVHAAQRQQVQRQQRRADQAQVQHHRRVRAGQQAQRRQAQQHDAEGRRQQVRRAGVQVDRLARLQRVDDDQEQQVEDAGAERVADRQVRRVDHGHRADARGQLGQRGHGGQQRQPDPAAAPAVRRRPAGRRFR